jgi:ABC-type Fe3+/spermidine/putrescine transport system ATPase subunit
MIAGHESPSSGHIRLGDRDITTLDPAARGTAMMFQSYALFPHLSVLDNVAFSARMKGVARAEREARARAAGPGAHDAVSPRGCRRRCRAGSSSAWRWRAR